jgi:hypothetical protein
MLLRLSEVGFDDARVGDHSRGTPVPMISP